VAIWDAWEPGFSEVELRLAEDRYGFRFPPDLRDLLRLRRLPHGYDWSSGFDAIDHALKAVGQGIVFDVEHNGVWWREWGPRPASEDERAVVVAEQVQQAPQLIPLRGHRFMPAQPSEAGNPVFSISQMDIIYYGANLIDYLSNEYGSPPAYRLDGDIRFTPFWSTAVERAYGPEAMWDGE
jgi:hypothetical protein